MGQRAGVKPLQEGFVERAGVKPLQKGLFSSTNLAERRLACMICLRCAAAILRTMAQLFGGFGPGGGAAGGGGPPWRPPVGGGGGGMDVDDEDNSFKNKPVDALSLSSNIV